MAVNAGTVYYTVDADTQKAIDAAVDMNKSLESVQSSMAKTDLQIKKNVKEWTKAGNTISKTGVVLDKFGNVNVEATQELQKLMSTTTALNEKNLQLSKTAQGVNAVIARMGRGAGQAGIQVQQFVGQIQGGQSAMLALSQQGADLGFVLGAPLLGAIIGISASLAGMFLPNLLDSKDALEVVENATENVRAAMTLSADAVVGYSDKMKQLATVSSTLAKVKTATLLAEQQRAMSIAGDKIGELLDETRGSFTTYQGFIKEIFGSITSDTYKAMGELSKATDQLKIEVDASSIEAAEQALNKATDAGINSTKEGTKLATQMAELIAQYKLGAIRVDDLKARLNDLNFSFDSGANSVNKYTSLLNSLTVKTHELRSAQLEQQKAITLQEEGYKKLSPEKQKAISDAYDAVIANTKEAESERALAKQKRENAKADREAQKAKKKALDEDQAAADVMIKLKTEYEKSKNLLGKVDPISGEQQRYQLELDNLKALNEAKLLEDQRYLELKSQAETEHENNMMALREENFRRQSDINEFLIDSVDTLGRAGTTAIAGMLSGTMSLNEAISNMANTILQQAVGALVEMGLQYVKNQIIGQAAADASAAASIATGMATSAALTAAYSTPAMLASIASYGGAAIAGEAAYLQALTTGKVAALSGMAHDGISSVPNEGTWLLNKGERVYTNDSARQLDQMYMRVMKPSYPNLPNISSSSPNQSEPQVNFSMQVINGAAADGYQVKQEMTEEGVKIIVAKYFNQNIDNGVSSVLGKKGTKTNKTLTSRYDTRNKL